MVLMHKLVVRGGKRLNGSIDISGSKNAVLPVMAASLLTEGTYALQNVPLLRDVKTMSKLLQHLGAETDLSDHTLTIHSTQSPQHEAPYDLVKTMRASIYVLGPLVSRFGDARVSLPGGCAWGPRPVNLHIAGLRKMGARIDIEGGYIHATTRRLRGERIKLDVSSVGATCNLLMAAVLAKGETAIENAAQEPEVKFLGEFLTKMGARIGGLGSSRIQIQGVDDLHPASDRVIPDRIETCTFSVAVHMTGGDIRLNGANPDHLSSVLDKLRGSGAHVDTGSDWIRIQSSGKIRPVDVSTAVYPGFPTDMQAQWMALMSVSGGSAVVTDTIFHDRFTHVAELQRLGANITVDQNVALVKGVRHLSGAPVMSTDLRASASLILAGLVANGRTDVSRVYHIDRGYEQIEKKLKILGADIWRDEEALVV